MSEPASTSRRVTTAVSIGTFIAGYDSLLYGYFASILAEQFFPRSDPTAALLSTFLIFALGFAVRPLGGITFGHIGDRLGRRVALAGSIFVMAVATLGIGMLPTYQTVSAWAPVLLLLCRVLQGFSVGGEYVGANILIVEHATPGRLGRRISANQLGGYLGISAGGATGLVLANILGTADLSAWGWRLPFLAAVPLGLIGLYLRWRIPDSPAFAAGRVVRHAFPLIAAFRQVPRGMLIYGGWLAMVGLGGYMLHGYLASYLIRVVGMSPVQAFGANFVTVVSLAAGAVAGGYLVDRYEPAAVGVIAAIGVAVLVVPGFLVIQQGTLLAAALGQVPLALCLGVAATFGASLMASLFPVDVRYTASAVAHNVAVTLFGSTAPYVSTWLIARTGSPTAPAWYLAGMGLFGVAVGAVVLARTRAAVSGPGPAAVQPRLR